MTSGEGGEASPMASHSPTPMDEGDRDGEESESESGEASSDSVSVNKSAIYGFFLHDMYYCVQHNVLLHNALLHIPQQRVCAYIYSITEFVYSSERTTFGLYILYCIHRMTV